MNTLHLFKNINITDETTVPFDPYSPLNGYSLNLIQTALHEFTHVRLAEMSNWLLFSALVILILRA